MGYSMGVLVFEWRECVVHVCLCLFVWLDVGFVVYYDVFVCIFLNSMWSLTTCCVFVGVVVVRGYRDARDERAGTEQPGSQGGGVRASEVGFAERSSQPCLLARLRIAA